MNDMKEKAMGAVRTFLERKGYEIVDEAWQGPEGIGGIDLVAVDEDGTLVFVDATVRIGTDGFPEAHRARGLREALAATWLAGKIYRVGILMYGKKPTLQEILKWVRYR